MDCNVRKRTGATTVALVTRNTKGMLRADGLTQRSSKRRPPTVQGCRARHLLGSSMQAHRYRLASPRAPAPLGSITPLVRLYIPSCVRWVMVRPRICPRARRYRLWRCHLRSRSHVELVEFLSCAFGLESKTKIPGLPIPRSAFPQDFTSAR